MSTDASHRRSIYEVLLQALAGAGLGGVGLAGATFSVCAVLIGLDGWSGVLSVGLSFYAVIVGAIIGAVAWPIRCGHVAASEREEL